jgi:CheY-like chemotaxis protein
MQPDFSWRGSRPVPLPAVPARTEGAVVLVVTNDVNLRAAATRVLTDVGHGVMTAAHAGHAVLACLANRVDVLVAELAMDDVSGPALASRLRRFCPNLYAVYLGNAGTAECEGVVVRPFTRDDLVAAVGVAAAGATASASGTASRPAAR